MAGPARRRPARKPAPKAPPQKVLQHELEVHQEELRAQNEKLVSVMANLEEARDRYLQLYDFAPIGYLTLDLRGFVSEINLSALTMLGRLRHQVVGLPILRLVSEPDRGSFLRYLSVCRLYKGGPWPVLELTVQTPTGARSLQLTCRPHGGSDSRALQFFTALIDITERRRLEIERETARRQQADLVRQMMTVQEHERQRIARDIHDDLGQQITGLRLKLEWLVGLADGNARLAAGVATVQDAAAQLDRHVDFLLRDLRPAGLDDLGLVTALEQTVQEWSATFGIPAEFRTNGKDGRRLSPDTEGHLYRIVQEALNNVHKHASARHVLVTLERHGSRATLLIRDDGIGIEEAPAVPAATRRGLGLVGMHERAALIGARFEIVSAPGRGTTVVIELN